MENNLVEIRRQLLAAEVERQGQAKIARLTNKPDSQIRDMISGRKTFGDRVARQIGPMIRPDLSPDWLLSPSQPSLPAPSKADPVSSIDGLMTALSPMLAEAPDALKSAVLALVTKYNNDPAEGERIAEAIKLLIGTDKPKP